MQESEYRAVLRWGENPEDLDSHLFGRFNGTDYHIYFSDKSRGNYAVLDVDDTESYGPETTTFSIQSDAEYRFYIHDYTNRNNPVLSKLSQSGATVTLYGGSSSEPLYVWNVPAGAGIYWYVFRIANGTVIPVNTISGTMN